MKPRGNNESGEGNGASRHGLVLRRAYRNGAKEYGSLPFSFETFGRHVTGRIRDRLLRAGAPDDDERVGALLARVNGADLYLAVACDHRLEEAWRVFGARLVPRLRGLLLKKRVPKHEIDDVLASLPGELVAAPPGSNCTTRIGTYDGLGSLFYWLVTFVFRRLGERARVVRRVASLESLIKERTAATTTDSDDPAHLASVRELCQRLSEAVTAAWERLSPRHVLVLRFKFLSSRTQKEAARVLGISEAMVSTLLHQGLERTRAAVAPLIAAHGTGSWPDFDQLRTMMDELLQKKKEHTIEEPRAGRDPPDWESPLS